MNKQSFNHSAIHVDQTKKKQIETLKSLKEEIYEVCPDLYHIPFLVGTHQLVLKVQLPDEFPRSQPLIWIYPIPPHNWVTEQGRIMSPGLVNYTQNSELGCLVHEIIREMRKSITSLNYPIKNSSTEQPALPSAQPIAYTHLFTLPPYIPELESLTGDKIKLLNENKDFLDDFTEELPQALEIYKDLGTQQQHLVHLSETVSDLKRNVNMQRQKIIEHYGVLNQMKEHWDSLSGKHQELAQRYIPNNIETSLRSAAAIVDEQSEEIAENFLSSQIDVETFLNGYLSTRSLSHLRKAKEEILNKQLLELQRSGCY